MVNADLFGARRAMACWATPTQAKLGTTSKPKPVVDSRSNQLTDEMVKRSRDDVEDFEDVSGTPCCPPPVLFTAQRAKLSRVFNAKNYL